MAVLFTFAILPNPAFALTYRYNDNSGAWGQYTSGLTSSYYANDGTFTTYDRGFEYGNTTDFVNGCNGEWCSSVSGDGANTQLLRSTDFARTGSYSLKIKENTNASQTKNFIISPKTEFLGDANISLYYKKAGAGTITLSFGYFNQSNSFITLDSVVVAGAVADWTYFSAKTSNDVNYGIQVAVPISSDSTLYIDDIVITRNNTGTFRNSDPQYCNSINSCSNITDYLPSNQLDDLYWVVDYVAGASCGWAINGSSQGLMIEGSGGMYYALVNHEVTSGAYDDLNLTATCSKIPFIDKSFFTSPKIMRYGLSENGSFEDSSSSFTNTCVAGWCNTTTATSSTPINIRYNQNKLDGKYALYSAINTNGATSNETYMWSLSEYYGGEDVYFHYKQALGTRDAIYFGYVNDANSFTALETLNNVAVGDWNEVLINLPVGSYRPAFRLSDGVSSNVGTYIDLVSSSGEKEDSTLTTDNNLVNNFGLRGTTYLFTSDYQTTFDVDVANADCNLTIDGIDYAMVYSSANSRFEYSTAFTSDAVSSVTHTCESPTHDTKTETYSIEIISPASTILEIGDLVNIGSSTISDYSNDVNFSIIDKSKSIGWSIISQENDYLVQYNLLNNLLESNQYYVYTSNNGTSWTFNDSLTYGSGDYNSVLQKVRVNDDYSYVFDDTLISGNKKYYKLEYRGVAKYWQTIKNSSDWVHVNDPEIYTDLDGQQWDLFSDSNYSNISSYTSAQYPDLTSSDFNTGIEFQFTAYASRETTLVIGTTNGDGTGSAVGINIGVGKQRYSVPLDPSKNTARIQIYSTETTSARVYITDYAFIPKSYFINRLELRDADNSSLGAISIGATSNQVIREGLPFKFVSSAYDINGNLETLRIEASLNGTIVKTYDFDLSEDASPSSYYSWNEIISGVIDLNGWYGNPSDLRNVYLTATLIDDAGNEVAEQSSTIKLLQYPFFADDITFNVLSTGNKVGDNPKFRIDLEQQDPDRFVGLRMFIYDANHSLTDPNYTDVIFSDELNCGFFCTKELLIKEWVWEQETTYSVDFMILVNTETENYNNDLLYKKFSFRPSYRVLETARIFQVYERTDFTYRNDEKIPLVLQLRDLPYRDLSQDYSVYLKARVCDADTGGTCDSFISHNFNPTKFIYDEKTGYNYFYFNTLFYDSSGDLIQDGNYLEIRAIMTERSGSHEASTLPTLASKCASASYGASFLNGWFGMNATDVYNATTRLLFGCTTPASPVVEVDDAEMIRLLIDEDHNVVGGQNQSLVCLNADNNNNYVNNLEQDIFCMLLFKRSQQSIDSFTTYIGNENSDYSENSVTGQYLKFEIPADYIIFNDPVLLQSTLNSEYATDSIDTLGELAFYGFDGIFSGIANPLTDVVNGVGTATGLITNYNFDLNWDKTLDPAYVDGIFFFKISGIKVLNQYDYLKQFPVLETQNPKYFTKWANQNSVTLPEQKTTIEVFSSEMESIIKEKIPSNIVIFKAPNTTTKTNVDADGNVTNIVATRLKFNIIEDMLSNNESAMSRIFLPLTLSYIVPDLTNPFIALLNVGGEFLSNPLGSGLKYWFWFVLIIALVLVISVVYKNFKGGGNIVVNNKGA